MLHVKTRVLPSSIQGLGLFAAEPIAAGTLIAQFDPAFGWTCTEIERLLLPPSAREFVWRYGWRPSPDQWFMDIDDSRFMNHSDTPNMAVTEECGYTARAARDILSGEELTEDYRQFDPDFESYSDEFER